MTLPLYQSLMLLALGAKTGNIKGDYISYPMAGAMLADLLLSEHIAVGEGRKGRVKAIHLGATGDPLLDETLQKIHQRSRPRTLKAWVEVLGQHCGLPNRIAHSLADKGIVKRETKKVLWVFNKQVFPEVNPLPEDIIHQRLRSAVFDTHITPEVSTMVLMALAKAAKLLSRVFTKDELAMHKHRINQLADGQLIGASATQAVKAAESAAAVAAIIPIIAASTVVTVVASS